MSSSPETPLTAFSRTSRPGAWLRLLTGATLLWLFFGFVGPWFVTKIPAWQRYGAVQEEQGLDSGALYYTDVPVSLECEQANRAAVARALELRRAGLGGDV